MLKICLITNHLFRRRFGCILRVSDKLGDYDVVINPDSRLFDEYMAEHGSKRFDFKKEDYFTWKSAWGHNYRFGLFFLKGTQHLAFSFHTIQYKSFGHQPDFRHLGMAWIPEKYRGKELLKVVTDYLRKEELMKSQNMLACNLQCSQNFWKRATGQSDMSLCTYYISYYGMSEFCVPITRIENNDCVVVKHVDAKTVSDVLKYDRTIFPFDRENWMISLFTEGIGRVAYSSDGEVVAIGCISVYPSGECVISPLYADNPQNAQCIFQSMLEEVFSIKKKLWRIQVRSNDQCAKSFEWIMPFLKTPIHRSPLSNLCYSMYPPKNCFDFTKVFVNAHPTNGPC